jgi:hypothetical protein
MASFSLGGSVAAAGVFVAGFRVVKEKKNSRQ